MVQLDLQVSVAAAVPVATVVAAVVAAVVVVALKEIDFKLLFSLELGPFFFSLFLLFQVLLLLCFTHSSLFSSEMLQRQGQFEKMFFFQKQKQLKRNRLLCLHFSSLAALARSGLKPV